MSTAIKLFLVTLLCTLTALPAIGAINLSGPEYGTVVMNVQDHFALIDQNRSGTINESEYIEIADGLKNQAADEASADFNAMDMNKDAKLTLEEFYGEMPSALTL